MKIFDNSVFLYFTTKQLRYEEKMTKQILKFFESLVQLVLYRCGKTIGDMNISRDSNVIKTTLFYNLYIQATYIPNAPPEQS